MRYRGFFIGFGSLDEGKIQDLNFFTGHFFILYRLPVLIGAFTLTPISISSKGIKSNCRLKRSFIDH